MGWLDRQERRNSDTGKVETYWSIQDRIAGVRFREPLGYVSEKEAEKALKIYEGNKAKGLPTIPEPAAPPTPPPCPTMREWWGDGRPWPKNSRMYMYYQARGVSPSTIDIADAARIHILACLGDRPLDQIRASDGDRFVVSMMRQGLKARTCQLYITQLQRCLVAAQEDGHITTIPKLQRPKVTDAKEHLWHSPEESERLMETLSLRVQKGAVEDISFLAIFMTLSLGMRPGEALTRRWEDIDWRNGGRVRIQRQKMPDGTIWQPKTRTNRVVPLTPPLLDALLAAWSSAGSPRSGWIFPSSNVPGWPLSDFRKALKTSCRLAGLPELHPHALRHTAATRWAWSGVDRPTAMRLGGWKSAEMLDEVYAHTDESRMEEVMRATAVGKGTAVVPARVDPEAAPVPGNSHGGPSQSRGAACPTNLPHKPDSVASGGVKTILRKTKNPPFPAGFKGIGVAGFEPTTTCTPIARQAGTKHVSLKMRLGLVGLHRG